MYIFGAVVRCVSVHCKSSCVCNVLVWRGCEYRLKKLDEEFYEHVDPMELADVLDLDIDTVDCLYNYWVLKRKVRDQHLTFTRTHNVFTAISWTDSD